MSKKTIQVFGLPSFDATRDLRDKDDIVVHLTQVIEDGNTGELAQALGAAARVRGMAQIAEFAGVDRESLSQALRADASLRFDTVAKVCKALGLRLVVQAERSV